MMEMHIRHELFIVHVQKGLADEAMYMRLMLPATSQLASACCSMILCLNVMLAGVSHYWYA